MERGGGGRGQVGGMRGGGFFECADHAGPRGGGLSIEQSAEQRALHRVACIYVCVCVLKVQDLQDTYMCVQRGMCLLRWVWVREEGCGGVRH